MKIKHLILIAAIMLSADLFSQSLHIVEYEEIDGLIVDETASTMQSDNGKIFIAVHFINDVTRIMEMTDEGEIIDSRYIEMRGSGHRGFHPFFSHPDEENTNVYVYITRQENEIPTYNAVFFDNDLNVIKEISKPLYTSKEIVYGDFESFLLDSENNIVVRIGDGADNSFLFVKMDIEGNILIEKEVVIETHHTISAIPYHSLCVYNNEPLQYGFIVQIHNHLSSLTLAVLDADFNVVEIKNQLMTVDLINQRRFNMIGFEDSYLVSTSHFTTIPVFSHDIRLSKYDKNHNLISKYEYKQKTVNNVSRRGYLGYRNIVETEDGGIYWIYSLEDINDNYSSSAGELYVTYFDKDLNKIWEQNLIPINNCGSENIFSATVCDDGDLVISVVFRVEKLVTIVINNETLNVTENAVGGNPFTLYPNPAGDNVSVRFAEGAGCEMVEIYSLDGRRCHAQNFNLESIDLSGLSSGVYMMKVVMENGEVFTEKIAVK